MEETGVSQMSLTDADARLMKNKNGVAVLYNPQTALDFETHLIRDFEMTNQVTDHGMLVPTMAGIREEDPGEILEAVADKGYENVEDMAKYLENGIIPYVIMDSGKDGYEIESPYEQSEADAGSTAVEELKKSLRAGKLPEAYEEVISDMRVEEVRRKVKTEKENGEKTEFVYGNAEKMLKRAKEGYHVRDPERNLVYCPASEIQR